MPVFKNITAGKNDDRAILVDVFAPEGTGPFPVMLFFHGTKGFKDWGAWPWMYRIFNHHGIALVTVNFSHNGVVLPDLDQFSDMEGYAENTIGRELQDMKICVDWVTEHAGEFHFDPDAVILCGHSRAGGEAIIYAGTDNRISKLIAWSAVTGFADPYRLYDREKWKSDGYILIPNTRTGQELPVNVSFIEDIENHAADYHVIHAAARLKIPTLFVHGSGDETVPLSSSQALYDSCLHALLIVVDHAGHTFGTRHPWGESEPFPHEFQELLDNTVEFILD